MTPVSAFQHVRWSPAATYLQIPTLVSDENVDTFSRCGPAIRPAPRHNEKAEIDRAALIIVAAETRENSNLRGASRMKRLSAVKKRLIVERRGEVVARLRP
jgi:hypothetical protein